MRTRAVRTLLLLAFTLMVVACDGLAGGEQTTVEPLPTVAIEAATETPAASSEATAPAASSAAPTRVGTEFVLRLPREDAVPGDWVMSPQPDFQTREPASGATYRYACLDLPARSVGVASVGYRHLEGLPSVYIEYVLYPSAAEAAAALEDMRRATEGCPAFTIGEGDGAIEAALAPLDFPPHGDDSFAAALTTNAPATGELLTHAIKILSGRIVVGINHAVYADEAPPDAALTGALAALVVQNLAGDFH
jgi:hypothetical protein